MAISEPTFRASRMVIGSRASTVLHPSYDTFFRKGEDGITHSGDTELPVSGTSFVAFKFPVSRLYGVANPEVKVSVTVTSTNMLGNELGMLGLYEMSDSNWTGGDGYSKVSSKVNGSPVAVSAPIADHDCDGKVDPKPPDGYESNPVEFTVPEKIVRKWKECNLAQVSLVLGIYRDFETGGELYIGSNESDTPIGIQITEGVPPVAEPFDLSVTPSTISPAGRATVTAADGGRHFGSDIDSLVVTVDGERANILSGNEYSLKIVVPDISGKVEGMVDLAVYDSRGTLVGNQAKVYFDASATRRNRYFAEPSRPGNDNVRASHSAVYNRDLGFNGFTEVTDENSIVQNIYNILLTRKGERLFNPDFGTTIEERVFDIMNEDDETRLLQECFEAIREYEPRVSVDYEESRVDVDEDSNTIRVIIAVVLPNGNSENIVLPFKTRGTVVR